MIRIGGSVGLIQHDSAEGAGRPSPQLSRDSPGGVDKLPGKFTCRLSSALSVNRITVGELLTHQLENLVATIELVDESGRSLGHFVPRHAQPTSDDCPYAEDELRAMRAEQGGRPLTQIWMSLGAQ